MSQGKVIMVDLDKSRMEVVERVNVVQNLLGIETDPMETFMQPLEMQMKATEKGSSSNPAASRYEQSG